MNFGESLAYWYFRLNGFLPVSNFVLHKPQTAHRNDADADLIAVRFPHVFEQVGGEQEDWDNKRFSRWGLDHLKQTVCVICEVKTGKYANTSLEQAFSDERMRYALCRIGIVPREDSVRVVEEFPAILRRGIVR